MVHERLHKYRTCLLVGLLVYLHWCNLVHLSRRLLDAPSLVALVEEGSVLACRVCRGEFVVVVDVSACLLSHHQVPILLLTMS